jgi:hypothetical protein
VKKVLLVLVVLALAGLACSTGAVPTPQIVYVEVTPVPQVVPPTVAPPIVVPPVAPPKASYDATGIPARTVAYLEGEGFRFTGQETTGQNSCAASTCTHWQKNKTAVSFYVNRGEFTGVVVSFPKSELGASTGELSGYVLAYSGVPEDAMDAVIEVLGNGGGSKDVPSGWRAVVVQKSDRIYILAAIPGRNVGSTSGSSANA